MLFNLNFPPTAWVVQTSVSRVSLFNPLYIKDKGLRKICFAFLLIPSTPVAFVSVRINILETEPATTALGDLWFQL